MDFVGKRALVTGAGAGIGRGIALKLAEKGAHVIALSRTKSHLDSLVSENSSIEIICVDLQNLDEVEKLVRKVLPIQLLVNNAGVLVMEDFLETTNEAFDLSFSVNLKAPLKLIQIVSKDLIQRSQKGSIVNISSVAGHRGSGKDFLLYGCTKASLNSITQTFSSHLGSKGIRVNAVSPSYTLTEMAKRALEAHPEVVKGVLERIPQGKAVEVDEVANCTLFLLSDQSEMVNGHLLPVDGGSLALL